MADSPDAPLILLMFVCFDALRRSGWQEANYAPIDVDLELIEPGSSGIHRGRRDEQRGFWIHDDVDIWPANPVLFRRLVN